MLQPIGGAEILSGRLHLRGCIGVLDELEVFPQSRSRATDLRHGSCRLHFMISVMRGREALHGTCRSLLVFQILNISNVKTIPRFESFHLKPSGLCEHVSRRINVSGVTCTTSADVQVLKLAPTVAQVGFASLGGCGHSCFQAEILLAALKSPD